MRIYSYYYCKQKWATYMGPIWDPYIPNIDLSGLLLADPRNTGCASISVQSLMGPTRECYLGMGVRVHLLPLKLTD